MPTAPSEGPHRECPDPESPPLDARLHEYLSIASALSDEVVQGRLERGSALLARLEELAMEMRADGVAGQVLDDEHRELAREALAMLGICADEARRGRARLGEEIQAIGAIRAHLRAAAGENSDRRSAGGIDLDA